jgi:hypothetical protein
MPLARAIGSGGGGGEEGQCPRVGLPTLGREDARRTRVRSKRNGCVFDVSSRIPSRVGGRASERGEDTGEFWWLKGSEGLEGAGKGREQAASFGPCVRLGSRIALGSELASLCLVLESGCRSDTPWTENLCLRKSRVRIPKS